MLSFNVLFCKLWLTTYMLQGCAFLKPYAHHQKAQIQLFYEDFAFQANIYAVQQFFVHFVLGNKKFYFVLRLRQQVKPPQLLQKCSQNDLFLLRNVDLDQVWFEFSFSGYATWDINNKREAFLTTHGQQPQQSNSRATFFEAQRLGSTTQQYLKCSIASIHTQPIQLRWGDFTTQIYSTQHSKFERSRGLEEAQLDAFRAQRYAQQQILYFKAPKQAIRYRLTCSRSNSNYFVAGQNHVFKYLTNANFLIINEKSFQNMQKNKRTNQLSNSIKERLDFFIKQPKFPRQTIPQLIKLLAPLSYLTIEPLLQTHSRIMESIKWLILLHNMVLAQPNTRENQLQGLIQKINSETTPTTSLQTILLQKMVLPYKTYLLKRNVLNLQEVDSESQCFVLINLIKAALAFTNILFTIGRYLFQSYPFLGEFNVVMAKDLSSLYKTLDQSMSERLRGQNFEVIQVINEHMESIFYNCYFKIFVSCYAPKWIDTDQFQPSSLKQLKNHHCTHQSNHFGTQKALQTSRTQAQSEHGIPVEQGQLQFETHFDPAATADSKRYSKNSSDTELANQQRSVRQRKEFICLAKLLIVAFKQQKAKECD